MENKELYRHIFYDPSQDIIKFNYMKQPNVKLVFNEYGTLVDILLAVKAEEVSGEG